MRQFVHRIEALGRVVAEVCGQAVSTDVFVVDVSPLRRRGRLQDVVEQSGVVWADCDTPEESVLAPGSFPVAPSMFVASGSADHRHAYWFLQEPIDLALLERLNRRLALAWYRTMEL